MMNYFDVEKTKTKFLLYSEFEEVEDAWEGLGKDLSEEISERGLLPFGECIFYLYEGISITFILLIDSKRVRKSESDFYMKDIESHPLHGFYVESKIIKKQIANKIKLDFVSYLAINEFATLSVKNNLQIVLAQIKAEIEPNKDTGEKTQYAFDTAVGQVKAGTEAKESAVIDRPINEKKEEPILDAIKEAEEKIKESEPIAEPTPSVKEPEQTIDNNFNYDNSNDEIPFDPDKVISTPSDIDIDSLFQDIIPQQESPHKEEVVKEEPVTEEQKEEVVKSFEEDDEDSETTPDSDMDFSDMTMSDDEDDNIGSVMDGF